MIGKCIISTLFLIGSIIAFRGGLQKIPFTSSNAFFSQNNSDNFAAVNKLRFLFDSFEKANSIKKHIPHQTKKANLYLRKHHAGESFLKSNRPNILLIILEGIPSLVLDSLYFQSINIPFLRDLKYTSYDYDNVFASGFRTDQGLSSLLSGIPAYPYINTLKDIDELGSQPSLLRSLNDAGYYTSFHYGGDSHFSSMKKYLLSQNLDFLMDQSLFTKDARQMDWGVPDHILLEASAKHILSLKSPFFTTILTSSTHLPFDFPGNDYKTKSKKENYISSLEYLDKSLKFFLDTLGDHLENIVYIITSDHGCLYLGHDFNDHNRFKVPFLIFGDAIQEKLLGTKNSRYFNTHDFPLTINNVLQLADADYPLSCDMTTLETKTSAYWITEHTMGWTTHDQSIVSNHECTKIYRSSHPSQTYKSQNMALCDYHNSTITHLQNIINK